MKPFRRHVGIAIDGGGIRGVVVTRALAMLEDYLGQSAHQIFRLAAGTSTGSVISAGIAAGLPAHQLDQLYIQSGGDIFRKTWRSRIWPLSRYRYSSAPLERSLGQQMGDLKMGELWRAAPPTDLVITTFDLQENRTRFLKPWKDEYKDWPLVKAVMASCAVPAIFPVVDGRYADGGVGAYTNPCYLAAYELLFCLGWKPAETTLLSLGTGRSPSRVDPKQANRMWPWQWLVPLFGAYAQSADDQQVHLVNTFFQEVDFRRFQIDLPHPIDLDDVQQIPRLAVIGEQLGRMILNDQTDPIQDVFPRLAPGLAVN